MSCARLIALLALLAACQRGAPPSYAPQPRQLTPAGGPRASSHAVLIDGDRFYARGVVSLGSGGASVDDGYSASLGGVQLQDVRRLGDGQLAATVPAGVAPGALDLVVMGPFGLTGGLARAWTASDLAPALLEAAASGPARVSTGQSFALTLSVRNAGGALAREVQPLLLAPAAAFEVVEAPAAQEIPGGAARSFAWRCLAREPGIFSASLAASGADAVSLLPVATRPAQVQGLVERRAALVAGARVPAPSQVEPGQPLSFSLAVSNTGAASALAIDFPAPQVSGSASLELASQE